MLAGLGVWMASHRPLWNDEYYSLLASITNISYSKILSGGIPEGNNSPLFYILQKLQCDLFFYHPSAEWTNGHWGGLRRQDWVLLRIQPVIFMAGALSVLFSYFARRYSLLAGFYALALALSSIVVWDRWTEARPYALWFALSIFQMLLLMNAFKTPGAKDKNNSRYLILSHCLLALTVVLSAVQILAAGCVLWIRGTRSWKFYLPAVFIPLGMILFYYCAAPKYDFCFVDGPVSLISANFPKERVLLALMFVLVFIYGRRGKKKWMVDPQAGYLAFMVLMLAFFTGILIKLKLSQWGPPHGFQIPSRYFMSLAPMSIIGTTIFSVYLMRAFPSKLWRIAVVVILTAFLVFRIQKTMQLFPSERIYNFHTSGPLA